MILEIEHDILRVYPPMLSLSAGLCWICNALH